MQFPDTKLKRIALYETVADELEKTILEDETRERRLPSEQYLADRFGVSRPVIREALKILKERGFIDSHQGAQSVITLPGADTLMRSVDRIVKGRNISALQLYEIRTALEVLSATLAAQNAGNEDIEELKRLNKEFEDKSHTTTELSRFDIDFHLGIAEASGNALLKIMIEAISPILFSIFEKTISEFKTEPTGVVFHNSLIAAIEKGDSEEASRLMKEHIELSYKNFEFCDK